MAWFSIIGQSHPTKGALPLAFSSTVAFDRENKPQSSDREILTTDRYEFGGRNRLNEDTVRTVAITDENGSRKNQITLTLPALGGVVLKKQLG